ncbi:type II/IV secretion system protein [Candidatus Woesebacteria bacterium]|nr:MAG: type II/IV secretion system protein [Candidatus Woesebacteria bacterium]
MNPPIAQYRNDINNYELERIFSGMKANPVEFVDIIIKEAVKYGASDVLLEPRKDTFLVRSRIDGVLYKFGEMSIDSYPEITSRLKILSGLDPTEKRHIQEGQSTTTIDEKQVNLRVEIAQTVHGELVVIRIHEKKSIAMDLSQLGLNNAAFQTFETMVKQKSGLILVSGPTGSGKTTTLYSTLIKLNENKDQNVMTIEDPVEFHLDGINQMQVDEANGFTFAKGLSTILRLTPDIVLVGEIRDRETAKIAIESGLTGQLVLSTAHAEDSVRTLFRLMDLGVETYFLNSALMGVIAQRLVRKSCTECKEIYQPTQKEIDIFTSVMGRSPKQLIKSRGCEKCNNLGYKGRVGIFEVLYIDSGVRELLRMRANEDRLKEALTKNGFITLLKDGLDKAENGITTIDEVLKNSLRVV